MAWPHERARHGGIDEIPVAPLTGRLWLAGKHFVAPNPEATLDGVGASAIVCLCEAHELDRYPTYAHWLQVNAPARATWWPIPDMDAPDVEHATQLVAQLRTRLESGAGLVVHCAAGIGRAGAVTIALLLTLGTPLDEATRIVATHRPMAGPEAGPQRMLLAALAARQAT